MKRTMSTLLALGMIAALLSVFAGTAGAQTTEPSGQITAVNGLDVTVDVIAIADADGSETELGKGVGIGEVGKTPAVLPAGTYTVEFRNGTDVAASFTLNLGEIEAWVIAAGAADPNATNAAAYEVDLNAKTPAAAVANASADIVTATPPGTDVAPAALLVLPNTDALVLASTSGLTVDATPATGASAYTTVVAIGPADGLVATNVTIPDLAALKTSLEGTTPPTTLPPATDVSVPDVTDRTEADAVAAIEGVNLVVAKTEAASDTIDAGIVISQDPAPDTEVAEGTTVNIVVSTGPDAPAVVPVPDVVGQDAADARTTLEAAGFIVEITELDSETVEAGLVIDMNPAAGTEVAEGTTVALTVSSGMGDVVVPDFSGMTIAEATQAAEDAGLAITFVQDPNNPDPEGVVISQDPEEGTAAEAGTEVVAQLSPKFEDAWSILMVDANRELTVTGINFQFNSTTESAVIDTTISQTAPVGQSGSWTTKIDISSLDSSEHFLKVTGTAEDGSDYDQVFKIPAAGESTDVATTAEDGGGFPWWGWLIIGLLVVAVVGIGIKVFGGSDDDDAQPPATS